MTNRATASSQGSTSQKRSPSRAVKLPTKLKVGALDYSVAFDSDRCGDASYGMTFTRTTEIVLHENQSAAALRDTVLHESLHAIFESAGLVSYKGLRGASITPEQEEYLVRHLTGGVLQLIRDNPNFIRFLQQ